MQDNTPGNMTTGVTDIHVNGKTSLNRQNLCFWQTVVKYFSTDNLKSLLHNSLGTMVTSSKALSRKKEKVKLLST